MEQVHLESPSVQSYLTILQGVISRTASNSASSKTWCIALVSAIVVTTADKAEAEYVWVSMVPIVLFFLLDSYYLGLERTFRKRFNAFIKKLHEGQATVEDVFIIAPAGAGSRLAGTAKAATSVSVWPFYVLLVTMLLIVKRFVL